MVVRKYYEQLYAKKQDDLGKMDKFVKTFSLPKLNQEEAETLNRLIIITSENEAVVKKLPANGDRCHVWLRRWQEAPEAAQEAGQGDE